MYMVVESKQMSVNWNKIDWDEGYALKTFSMRETMKWCFS